MRGENTILSVLFMCTLCAAVLSDPMVAQVNSRTFSFINNKVALCNDGTIAVVCNTSPSEGGYVFLSILDSLNNYVCEPIIVNLSLRGYGQNADVGFDNYGRITIVWEQRKDQYGAVYRIRYSKEGAVIDSVKLVTDSLINAMMPRVTVHRGGKNVVVWVDYRSGSAMIYAQRYFETGKKYGNNFLITKGTKLPQFPFVKIGIDLMISFVWQDSDGKSFRIYTQSVDWNLTSFTKHISVDQSRGKAYASNPELLIQNNGDHFFVWKDYRTGESNIYLQKMKKGKLISSNILVNDDKTVQWQRLAGISGSGVGKFVCVWEDYRNDKYNQIGDIYAQIFSRNGKSFKKNIRVNESPEPTVQEFPAVAMSENEEFVITWNDARDKQLQVFLQRFTSNGKKSLQEMVVFPKL